MNLKAGFTALMGLLALTAYASLLRIENWKFVLFIIIAVGCLMIIWNLAKIFVNYTAPE